MKRMIVLVFFAALVPSGRIFACTCFAPTVAEAREMADVVFAGTAVKIQYVSTPADDKLFGEPRIIVTFNVFNFWKGEVGQTMTLHTSYNRRSCGGYNFEEGEKFLVYAKKVKAKEWLNGGRITKGVATPKLEDYILDTSVCAGTRPLTNAREHIKELGRSLVPK